MKTDLNGI